MCILAIYLVDYKGLITEEELTSTYFIVFLYTFTIDLIKIAQNECKFRDFFHLYTMHANLVQCKSES